MALVILRLPVVGGGIRLRWFVTWIQTRPPDLIVAGLSL